MGRLLGAVFGRASTLRASNELMLPRLAMLPIVYGDPLMHGALLARVSCVAADGRRALASSA